MSDTPPREAGKARKTHKLRERLLRALLTADGFEAAAREAGVSPATARRWRSEPEFQQAFAAARLRMWTGTADGLHDAGLQAVTTLTNICGNPEAPANARATAARSVLEELRKFVETDDILRRLAALEGKVGGSGSV